MAITRRQFLKRSCVAGAGSVLASWMGNPFVRAALADTIGDRYFVVLYLDGGNDGLNTVTPVDNGGGELRTAYEAARNAGTGGLRLSPSDLANTLVGLDPNTGAQLAIHPGFTNLKALYDAGMVAVIQNCGYPNYTLSHDEARNIWRTAAPFNASGSGWVGRHLAANYGAIDIPGVSITNGVPRDFKQATTSVLAIRRVRDFRFPSDSQPNSEKIARTDAFRALYQAAAAQPVETLAALGAGGGATLLSTESYPAIDATYVADRAAYNQVYSDLNSGTASDLREVAKIIYAVDNGVPSVNARFFQLVNGGYDTHSDQGAADPNGSHFQLHAEVGNALKAFYDDLGDMGVADKVCTIVWSEFSRRVFQNDNGTDHGSQGPVFVVGGGVNGGVYGNHPNISESALDRDGNSVYSQDVANAFRSTDIRDVYGTILKHWMNMPEGQILSGVLPADTGDPKTRWTAPNFDMGFV